MELARSSSDLFPMLASVQVSPAPGMGIVPYIGAGAGWEVLFISGDDFTTGDKFDATYGGWGWQAWAGVAIPTSHWTKLNAEVFLNRSEVSRDVDDGAGRFTETVNMDGAGMRFGLTWGF
jgi:hypothetical protein